MASTDEMSKLSDKKCIKIDNQIFLKANKIYLKLLSLVINELNKNKKISQNFQIHSINDSFGIINENKDAKFIKDKKENNILKPSKFNIIWK